MKGEKVLVEKKEKGWGQKECQPSTFTHAHVKYRSVTRLRNCPPPRICAYSSQDLHIFLSQCECRNPGHLSCSRINYTQMNPDKYSSRLFLKPSKEQIQQPFQAMKFFAPLSLPCNRRNSECALKTITFYPIHLNTKNRSFSSYLEQSFFEDFKSSSFHCCSLC